MIRTLLLLTVLFVLIAGIGLVIKGSATNREESAGQMDASAVSFRSKAEADSDTVPSSRKFAVSIRTPTGIPRLETGLRDLHGNSVTASCSTCHTTRKPNPLNKATSDLDEFHRGMKFSHGTISCLSCHNESDYDALKLADGSRVEYGDVMTLCAQCHGPQMTAYKHGAHGGMIGYWDLGRGPQFKNSCVDCHNPHAPQFPKMQPTFKPRDRFLDQPGKEH